MAVKRADIKTAVEGHLQALGFAPASWRWLPAQAELLLVIGASIKTIKLKSGTSERRLAYELGRIAGWAEFLGITPKPNGHAAAHVATGIPAAFAFAG
jgi:hypothetical protein